MNAATPCKFIVTMFRHSFSIKMPLTIQSNSPQIELEIIENFPFDVLKIIGNESVDFLQRISTNDFSNFKPGNIQKTLFISEKGRVIDAVWVMHCTEFLLIFVSPGTANELSIWLNKFIIMEDIILEDATSQYSVDLRFHGSHDFNTDYFGFPVNFIVRKKSTLTSSRSTPLFEHWRIENGIPAIKKELTQDYNPLELNLRNWISFTKGCYIGQEVIARLDTYNKIQRTLCKIYSPTFIAEGDICIDTSGNETGKITSVVESNGEYNGLAVIKIKHALPKTKLKTKNSFAEITIAKVFQKKAYE